MSDLNLPDFETLSGVWNDPPKLAPVLIAGVLRQGHKMLIAGASKAGKSFALIELSIAIAEGATWFKWQCAQGRVLYVNLEVDRASCFNRFKTVYSRLGISPKNLSNIDIWNLRGRAVALDKLVPELIERAQGKEYKAVIVDPIYKVLTGDENAADEMAFFCNQFDTICTEIGASVIYCHHHSKGSQLKKKSMDRASGSGVFARDPDALIDLVELERQNTSDHTAWRVEGTLREFPKFDPFTIYFDLQNPCHYLPNAPKTAATMKLPDDFYAPPAVPVANTSQFDRIYTTLFTQNNGIVPMKDMAKYMQVPFNTFKRIVEEQSGYRVEQITQGKNTYLVLVRNT